MRLRFATTLSVLLAAIAAFCAPAALLAGGGSVDASGDIHLNFHFRFPPTADDVTRVQEQIQRSSRMLCDATEGRMRIGTARLSAGGASEPAGDIWYFPPGAFARSSGSGGPLHCEGCRIQLTYGAIRADVVTHELGHLVMGLGDQYDEQRRFGGSCGIGRSFDAPDETNHTIMQQSNVQRCQNAMGVQDDACFNNADCPAGFTCPLSPLMSEFSTEMNNDQLRGDSVLPPDTCPSPLPGDTLTIRDLVYSTAPQVAFDPTDFDTADATAAGSRRVELLDSIGDVPRVGVNSSHILTIWAEHTGAQTWTLHFGIDDGEFDSGTDGDLTILDTIDFTFTAGGALDTVDGVAIADPAFSNPTISVVDFANGADDVTLEVEFDTSGTDRFRESGVAVDTFLRRSRITAGGVQQLGVCGQTDACEQIWNTSTDRWEASAVTGGYLRAGDTPLSDWEVLEINMDDRYGLVWTAPDPLPNPNAPGSCADAGNVAFDLAVEGADQIVMIIDRSFSMNEDRNNFGDVRQRIEWAQAGARAFADLQAGAPVDVGLISFNHFVIPSLPLRPIVDDASATAADHALTDFKDEIDALTPAGNTAIGDALAEALSQLNAAAAADPTAQQAVFLLTDGENNRGANDPQDVAEAMRDEGIQVFAVPLGSLTDQEFLEEISDETGGAILESDDGLELPTLYAELYARFRGEAPVVPRTPSAVRGQAPVIFRTGPAPSGAARTADDALANETLPESETFIIQVEPDAERLNVILSTRNDLGGTWDPAFALQNPMGDAVLTQTSAGVIADDFYRILRVNGPSPGDWRLTIFAQTPEAQLSYLLAHVENAGPDCYAGVAPRRIVDGSGPVEITAAASLGGPLGAGVVYNATVLRPGGSTVTVPLSLNESQIDASGPFDAFAGRGRYEVVVECRVTENARYAPGERATLDELLDAPRPTPFVRYARASFFLDTADLPPLDGPDTDNDGIPDDDEDPGDADGDGLPNAYDQDSDADDLPDSQEGGGDPTVDTDGDGILDINDPDSDNDGIDDGSDPDPLDPTVPDPTGGQGDDDTQGRYHYSFHVGSAHPLGDLNRAADANIYLQGDLGYRLTDRLDLKARLGFAQFTEETSTAADNRYWLHASLNAQLLFPTASGLAWYLQAGPGWYDPKVGGADLGFNLGAGARLPLPGPFELELGGDYHRVSDDFDSEFLTFQLGVLFR